MNAQEIRLLQQIRSNPCLTITLPTHRTSPENQQDPIRLKNLVEEAINRLLKEYDKAQVVPLIARLEGLVNQIEFRRTLDGLAIFVNRDFGRFVYLPFPLKERITIDDTFLTRDLVFALNRSPRYWVLALSEKPTRLFSAVRADLSEIHEGGFPMTHTGPGGEQPLPHEFGFNKSAYRDEHHRKFFRQVDSAFTAFRNADPLPIALVGVERFLAFYKEISAHRGAILVEVHGSHDKTSPHELGKIVWPLMEKAFAHQRQDTLQALEKAIGERRYASGIVEVWQLVQEGRGHILLVEEDYHCPARLDESGRYIIPVESAGEPGVLDDAVDDLIEMTLEKKGQVVFMDNGSLAQHGRIALILRY